MIGRTIRRVQRLLGALAGDRRANVLVLTALSLVPLTFAVGFGIDYTRAMKLRTRMNAAADAAALAAVNVAMMQQPDSAATAAARSLFNAEVSGLPGMIYDATNPSNPQVTIISTGGVNTRRAVTVSYSAQSFNLFGGILGKSTLTINGSATADATRAPHVNFYLLMDTSPSMLLPSTTAGLNAIRSSTGCAFACHTQNPRSDGIYVRNGAGKDIWLDRSSGNWCPVRTTDSTYAYCSGSSTKYRLSNGQYADSYWLTRNYSELFGGRNITLRIDEEEDAAQQLIPFAINTAANNRVTYKMQFFTYDWTHPGNSHPVRTITSTMTDVNALATYDVPNFYDMQDSWYINNCPTSTYCNSDMGSEVHNALVRMNTVMTTPGDGSTATNPQGVLFVITDGVADEIYKSGRWHREWNAQDLADCTAIKNRGIRIAVLYTEYLPESLTGDSWSLANVAPYLPNVEPALKACASPRPDGSPLYYKVTTDESIADALSALFSLTVQTARLTR